MSKQKHKHRKSAGVPTVMSTAGAAGTSSIPLLHPTSQPPGARQGHVTTSGQWAVAVAVAVELVGVLSSLRHLGNQEATF